MQVARIVHVDVGRTAVPALGGHVRQRLQVNDERRDLVRVDVDLGVLEPVLEALHDRERRFADWKSNGEAPTRVENGIIRAADPGVGV